jgi:valyl-tRNA synthetase
MMMMGIEFLGDIPFNTVYIHALVRDEDGQKMSKSKGNVIDPLDLINEYGADALRLTLTALAAQGRDVRLSESRVAGYRNFCTKLWNAARFCQMNGCALSRVYDPFSIQLGLNKWIVGKLYEVEDKVTRAINSFRFNDLANAIHHFTRHTFCDYYIEFAKPFLQGTNHAEKAETQETTAWVFHNLLKILHPITPYVTEELWREMSFGPSKFLASENWPKLSKKLVNAKINMEMDWVINLIVEIRRLRIEVNVPSNAVLPIYFNEVGIREKKFIQNHRDLVSRIVRVDSFEFIDSQIPSGSIQKVIDHATIFLSVAEAIDLNSEKNRIMSELNRQNIEITKLEKKLSNENFLKMAPKNVVEKEKTKLNLAQETLERLKEVENRLGEVK